jgi:hypothetical protein
MDAVDDFVETMAWLSYLDECEDRTRFNFEGLQKRWYVRRAAGLVGKPKPTREVAETRARSGTMTHVSDADLISYTHRKFEEKPRKVGKVLGGQLYGHSHVPRNMKISRPGFQGPIQQPRKQN